MAHLADPADISPRQVANKSDKKALRDAIRMTLGVQSAAIRHNTQTFNRNRYAATSRLADYNQLKDRARQIKEDAIAHLPELLRQLEASVRANGGHFYLAKTAAEADQYIRDVLLRHQVRLVVKGKSITSEETRLNHALEAAGVTVAETDLAEFILQVADEQPSHIVAPALHYSRERITALFKRKFTTDLPLDTGEELTKFAREKLRQQFIAADAGISGANLIAADSGSLMLVESEGNIRMTTTLPPLHIAIAGIEKVVPSRTDFGTFIELLPRSGTGQPLTSYVSILHPPLKAPSFAAPGKTARPREFHMVLIDNGRGHMREDPVLREALYCIRCSACLNSCANFETVGGHAFGGETYSGGIGGSWEAGTGKLLNARFSELCSGCLRCLPQCPVRIDVPWLNENLRQRINFEQPASAAKSAFGARTGSAPEDRVAPLQKQFFANYDAIARSAMRFPWLANAAMHLPFARSLMESVVGLDRRRRLRPFPRKTWEQVYRGQNGRAPTAESAAPRMLMLADVFTNYGSPERGMAAMRVLREVGVDVGLGPALPDGRSAISQGMIETARQKANAMAQALLPYIDQGIAICVLEPSVLAMLRLDYAHLLDPTTWARFRRGNFLEPMQAVWSVAQEQRLDLARIFPADRSQFGIRVFCHSQCQQRTCEAAGETLSVLAAAGFDVATSSVECCGMAGSFGYKREYYELSMAVGEDLFAQIRAAEQDGPRILVASGTSCHEQLWAGMGRDVLHPAELLLSTLG
ncbi:MAG TPA: LUD domain-containing protein [Candidatus Binatia bacterium]|nr:LUD domain-containing protein [Candidatus Binatia bacterium]